MKRNKLALLLLLAALAWSCSEAYTPVTVPVKAGKAVDAAAFADVYYIDFISDVSEAGVVADAEVRRAFLEEVPFALGRKVILLQPDHWDTIRGILLRFRLNVDIDYADSVFFRNVFLAHPRSLFFTGKLKLDVKKMGVVREKRDEKGTRRNAYETVQMWEMTARVLLIDGDSARFLLDETYSEKLEPGPGDTPQFSFNALFARLTAKLTTALQPRQGLQERFILVK